jgi:hypothetical protein
MGSFYVDWEWPSSRATSLVNSQLKITFSVALPVSIFRDVREILFELMRLVARENITPLCLGVTRVWISQSIPSVLKYFVDFLRLSGECGSTLKWGNYNLIYLIRHSPISVAVRSNMYVRSCLIAGIAGSNPTDGIDVRLLCLLCVV